MLRPLLMHTTCNRTPRDPTESEPADGAPSPIPRAFSGGAGTRGTYGECYGTEGREFESLRARFEDAPQRRAVLQAGLSTASSASAPGAGDSNGAGTSEGGSGSRSRVCECRSLVSVTIP